jgi:hypothetical protein
MRPRRKPISPTPGFALREAAQHLNSEADDLLKLAKSKHIRWRGEDDPEGAA